MGNSSASPQTLAEPRAQLAPEDRFSVQYTGHAFLDQQVVYNFLVQPPDSDKGVPCHETRHSYEDFQELDNVLAQRYRDLLPELPPSTFFENTAPEFITARAAGLAAYLEAVLQLEPLPKTRKLRRFLDVWQPLPSRGTAAAASRGSSGQLVAGSWRLPVGVVALVLSYDEPLRMLRLCSAVCRAMREASQNPRCWPTLRFRSSSAERWQDGLFALLVSVGGSLQALALDICYSAPHLGMAVPSDLMLTNLRRLSLSIWDNDALDLSTEVLECVESPSLQKVSLEGCLLTATLLHALCRAVLMTAGQLVGLKLLWAPKRPAQGYGPIALDESVALALESLLEAAPEVQELSIGLAEPLRGFGVSRSLASLLPPHVNVPNTQPLLANTSALVALRHLTFDFLSDDALVCLRELADRSLHLERARFTGVKRHLEEPEEALVVLLAKLGDELMEFSLNIELEAEIRPFMQGFLRNRIGALPNQWQHRAELRSLELNWTAFDGDGVRCITENCPQLYTFLLDRSEYWTDDVVTNVLESLPQIRHFRLRSAPMLTDQAIYALCENSHRFVTLELEPSYSMSSYALEQLRSRLNCHRPVHGANRSLFGGVLDNFDPAASAVTLMAAVAGVPDPGHAPGGLHPGGPHGHANFSSSATLQVLEEETESATAPELPLRGPLQIGW